MEDYIKAGFPVVFSDGFSAMIASIKVELMRITLITVQMFLLFYVMQKIKTMFLKWTAREI